MDRAGWDDSRRFEGGIFSGDGTGNFNRRENENLSGRGMNHGNGVEGGRQNDCYCYGCYGKCPYQKERGQGALVTLGITVIVALLIAFIVTLLCLLSVVSDREEDNSYMQSGFYPEMIPEQQESPTIPYVPETPDMQETPYIPEIPNMPEVPYVPEMPYIPDETIPVIPFDDWSGSVENGDYYPELQDAIRTDLSYSVEWENYEYPGNSETVTIAVDYPVIQGDMPNLDILNAKIAEETQYFEDYYAEYSKYMLPGEVFSVYAEGFVTYMDEEIMSVVFCENIYTDYWVDCGLYCINIDMENGVVLDNRSIVQIDDAFAVDFRMRSREQNGTVGELEYLSDQEIVHYLSGVETGILFYTPMGMEIGLNYEEGYVTVTYKDYEDYLQRY